MMPVKLAKVVATRYGVIALSLVLFTGFLDNCASPNKTSDSRMPKTAMSESDLGSGRNIESSTTRSTFRDSTPQANGRKSGQSEFKSTKGISEVQTFYVDATGGNDMNSGLSEEKAWRTLERIGYASFSAGDSILLKCGEVWREPLILDNIWGSPGNPITIGAYGDGEKPRINGAKKIKGWKKESDQIYGKSFSYEPRVVLQDNKLLRFLPWKGSVDATFKGRSPECWACDEEHNSAFVWCADGEDPNSHEMEVSAVGRDAIHEYGIRIINASYITIQDIAVMNTTNSGIKVQPGTGFQVFDIVLRRLHVFNTGSIGIEINNGTNSRTGMNEMTGVIVEDCVVRDTRWHGIELMYEVVGAIVSKNTVYRTGWGLDASHGITSWSNKANAFVHDCIIEGNTVFKVRSRLSTGAEGAGIQADDLTRDCLYRYNICYENEGSGLYFNGTSGCKFHYNICYGNGTVPGGDFRGGITLSDPIGIEIYNNVCFDNSPVGIGWWGEGTDGLKIKNNIFSQNADYEIRCGVNAARNVVSDSNLVYHPASVKFLRWFTADYNWSDWKRFSAQDESSVSSNPKLKDPICGDFRLTAVSPCINRGEDVGLARDLSGNSVPNGSKPDIGAYEYYDE